MARFDFLCSQVLSKFVIFYFLTVPLRGFRLDESFVVLLTPLNQELYNVVVVDVL